MKEVRFERVRGGITIEIKCDCGKTIFSNNSGTARRFRHKVKLSNNDKEVNVPNYIEVSCDYCIRQYRITPHVNHVHVEDV